MSTPPNDPNALARAAAATPASSIQQQLREKYQAILEIVWKKDDNCPICDSSAWTLGDLVDVHVRHTPQSTDQIAAALGGVMPQVYVYVPVTCIYCGYTLLFHSGVLDVREDEKVKAVPPIRLPKRLP